MYKIQRYISVQKIFDQEYINIDLCKNQSSLDFYETACFQLEYQNMTNWTRIRILY